MFQKNKFKKVYEEGWSCQGPSEQVSTDRGVGRAMRCVTSPHLKGPRASSLGGGHVDRPGARSSEQV